MMKLLSLLSIAYALMAANMTTVFAQDKYPSKPITIVVPYPPGGSNDVFARRIAKGLSDALKQTVVIENKPGASGNTGTAFVAKAPADGYTLAVVSSSMTTNAAIQSKMPFDPVKSFAPVAMFATGPFVAAVANTVPVKNPQELLTLLRNNPGKFNYASSGPGSSNQFATEMFKVASKTFVVHVPYRGMGPAVTDLISGQVQLLLASGPSLLQHVRSGRIRAVGITSSKPSAIAPELIPLATVVPGYDFELWWGMLAPAGTPPHIVNLLNAEVNKFINLPETKQYFLAEGAEVKTGSPADFAAQIASDVPRWKKLAQQQSIQVE